LLPGDTVADYRIVSAPLMMPDNLQTVLADMIGTYDTTLMRVAGWDTDTQQIEEYPEINNEGDLDFWGPGGAGWVLFRYGKTLNFVGYKTPEFDGPYMGKMGFLLELGNNWNMVGNPYNYPINVSSLIVITRSEPLGVQFTQDQTLTQGVFWVYQNGTYVSANILQPGEGGWIKVLAPSEDPELFFPSGQGLGLVGNRAVIDTTGLERPPAPPGAVFSSGGTNNASEAGGCFISTMD
jgi:hypothetical protein